MRPVQATRGGAVDETMRDLQQLRELAGSLRENLAKCASDPDVDPVHDTRTGTRRLQATIENLLRELPEDGADASREAAAAAMRVLKKIRRAAGPVRDLDVHRKLLSKLTKRALDPAKAAKHPQDPPVAESVAGAGMLETPQAGLRATGLEQQAGDLDAWLSRRRSELAQGFQAQAHALATKFDKRMTVLETALGAKGLRRGRKKPPAVVALESFARLATEMQALHGGNLHDFRKGAKKARYVAELATSGDQEAAQVGETLKRLQDEIGDWHDWLVLAEEAHAALGEGAADLIALVEGERDRHFVAAMKTAGKLRGRLMGEWLAVDQRKSWQLQSGQLKSGQRRSGQLKAGKRSADMGGQRVLHRKSSRQIVRPALKRQPQILRSPPPNSAPKS
jgi:CHAD domain-containing protein